ncbi:MAG: hypothetical protein KIS79_04635, partial [Burkholderiales bacterium]|nr:hypothetical protein [Burkholderiales bacterium]
FAEGMPASLAEWNLVYVADGRLRLNDRVEPYDLTTPLFTDYAHKLRTVWMPAGSAARYEPQAAFDFPVGTILSKTFYYPRGSGDVVLRSDDDGHALRDGGLALEGVRLVETRLLVKREDGWIALPYVWNAAQTEARLQRGGALVSMRLRDADGGETALDYEVPDQNQCAGCHGVDLKARTISPIGPKARHLDHELTYADGRRDNQLAHWVAAGYLDGLPGDAGARARDVAWNDPAEPLDARARAYLDINCGHCHSPVGAAKTSGMWLDAATTEPLRLGRCKLPIAAGRGTGGHDYGIAPGEPDASILTYRMLSTDPSVMMPELGRSLVHEEGVALIRDWIAAMDRYDCGG